MSGISGIGGAAGVQDIMSLRSRILEQQQFIRQLDQSGASASETIRTEAPQNDFASTLKESIQSVNESQQRAAAMSNAYERGETTDVASVMMARAEAGVAFEGALQTRNKLLGAYQEIMRMGL